MSSDATKYRFLLIFRIRQINQKQIKNVEYIFDRIFHKKEIIKIIYEHIKSLIEVALKELNVTIFMNEFNESEKFYTLLKSFKSIAFLITKHIFHFFCFDETRLRVLKIKFFNFKMYKKKFYHAEDKNFKTFFYIFDTRKSVFIDARH